MAPASGRRDGGWNKLVELAPETRAPAMHLAGQALTTSRHVCGFFRDAGEAEDVLVPFLAEGVANGDCVVTVVAADSRPSHLSSLQAGGIDVAAALESGQLEVEAWENTY